MVNIIPRLVVHQDEVAKIFDPIRIIPKKMYLSPATELPPVVENDEDSNENEELIVDDCIVEDTIRTNNKQGELIINSQQASEEQQTQVQGGIIDILGEFAEDVVNLGYDAVYRGVILAEDMVNLAEDYVVTLPHKASHSWWQLGTLLVVMTSASLFVLAVFFFVPLASVNQGLATNRKFLYGTMTYFEFLGLIPWVETCNFAMPDAKFTLRARIVSVMVGICFQTLVDAFIAEGWWSKTASKVFPIPFATVVSTSFALPITLGTLYLMTNPHRSSFNNIKQDIFQKQFKRCLLVLFFLLASFLFVGLWAVVFRRLAGHTTYQVLWAFMFAPFRFACKILVLSPVLTKLNPRRWIIMNFVVDMIFTRVQVATLPYIDGYPTMISLLLTSIFTLLWRYYSGVDRCAIMMSSLWRLFRGKGVPKEVKEHLGVSERITIPVVNIPVDFANVPIGLISASLRDIHQMGMTMRLNGRGAGPNSFLDWSDYENTSSDGDENNGMVVSNDNTHINGRTGLEVVPENAEDPDDGCSGIGSTSRGDEDMSVCTVNLDEEETKVEKEEMEVHGQGNVNSFDEINERNDSVGSLSYSTNSFDSSEITFQIIESIPSHDVSANNDDDGSGGVVIEFEESASHSSSKYNTNKARRRNWIKLSRKRQQQASRNDHGSGVHLDQRRRSIAFKTEDMQHTSGDNLSPPSEIFQPRRGGGGDIFHEDLRRRTVSPSRLGPSMTTTSTATGGESITMIREVQWEQRQFYHVIDSIGSETLSTIVRVHHQLSLGLMRSLPIRQHLNSSLFTLLVKNEDQWRTANVYGWTLIFANMVMIGSLSVLFQQCQPAASGDGGGAGGGVGGTTTIGDGTSTIAASITQQHQHQQQRLTLSRVMSYIYRDHFWFLFLWLTSTGAFACATMINHFGVDFTLEFEWLSCRETDQMAWPGCLQVKNT